MDFVTYECLMWKILRSDGVVLAVTDHDEDIRFEDVTYQAGGALDPSQAENKIGFSSSDMDVIGGVDGELFDAQEILDGAFEDAQIEHFVFDWKNEKRVFTVFSGRIANIQSNENSFRFDLRSSIAQLDCVFGRSFIKSCHAQFCDKACGLAFEDHSFPSYVSRGGGKILSVEKRSENKHLKNGIVKFDERPEAVAQYTISNVSEEGGVLVLELQDGLKFHPRAGEPVTLMSGCDKRFETCANYFDNAINFQAFPHMPGERILREINNENGTIPLGK